jgi:hypothetical protein
MPASKATIAIVLTIAFFLTAIMLGKAIASGRKRSLSPRKTAIRCAEQ